jgi:hypothetical protein
MYKKRKGFVLFLSVIILGLILLVSVLIVSISLAESSSQKTSIVQFEENCLINQIEYDFLNEDKAYLENHLIILGFVKSDKNFTYENLSVSIKDDYSSIIIYKNEEIMVNLTK